jgi:large subunit ribosomal protein L3
VTVIEAGPCPVTAIRKPDRDGYSAIQLAFDQVKESRLSKAELGHLKKSDAEPMRLLVEFRDATIDGGEEGDDGEVSLGQQVTVKNFEAGQKVKVAGITIGKGFQGTVKRHNFGRGPVSHGSHNVRAPGSIGASAYPARVFKGMRLPGQMGNKRATQKGLEIADIDAERNLLLIKGSVPGSRNSIVEIRTDGRAEGNEGACAGQDHQG